MERIRQVDQMPVFNLFYELALSVEKASRMVGPDFRLKAMRKQYPSWAVS